MKKKSLLILVSAWGIISLLLPLEAADADVYGKIISRGELRIGVSLHYPPLNFDGGKEGVEVMMARKLGEFLGVKVSLVSLNVSEYVTALEKNQVDMVIAGFSRNLQRGRTVWFSDPYLTVTPGVLVNNRALPQRRFGDEFEQNPINTIWDLKNLSRFTFAVKKGSSYEMLLNEQFPSMTITLIEKNEEGVALLEKGKVDAFVHDSLYLQYLYNTSAQFRGSFRLLQGGKQTEAICIGLPFGDTVLKNQVNLFIAELIRQGLIDEWLNTYNSR